MPAWLKREDPQTPQGLKGKQVQNLCELVTVNTENGCCFSGAPDQAYREVTGFNAREGRQKFVDV